MPATCDLLLLVPADTVAVAVIKAAIIGVMLGTVTYCSWCQPIVVTSRRLLVVHPGIPHVPLKHSLQRRQP